MFATNDPEWGILSTPVISDDRKTLYVVAWHDDGAQGIRYKLHALDLASGAEARPAAVIMGSSTDASQPCNTAGVVQSVQAEAARGAAAERRRALYRLGRRWQPRRCWSHSTPRTLTQKAMWKVTPNGVGRRHLAVGPGSGGRR